MNKGSTWDRTNNYAPWRAQRAIDGDAPQSMRRTSGTPTVGERISTACATLALDDLLAAVAESIAAGETVNVYSGAETKRAVKGLWFIRIEVGTGRYFIKWLSPADEVRITNALRNTVLHAGWQWAKAVQA